MRCLAPSLFCRWFNIFICLNCHF